jgi:hypothetical protein
MSDAKAVPYEAKIKWFCTTFLLFVELGLPSGKAKCLALFETNSGSGPSKKASKKSSLDKASTDEITTSILQTGGRSARRAVQGISAQSSKTPTIDLTVDESANFHDSETRTLLLNHNGLASWNSNSERLKSLLSMAVQFGDSTEKIQIARDNYTAHLLIPYVDVIAPVYTPVVRESRERKRPHSSEASVIGPIDTSDVMPLSLTSEILDTPSATGTQVDIEVNLDHAADVFGDKYESGHEKDDDPMSCSEDNDFRRKSVDKMKRCVVCLHKMRDARGRCHCCHKPLHTSSTGLSCYTSVRGSITSGQFQKWCRQCFYSLDEDSAPVLVDEE